MKKCNISFLFILLFFSFNFFAEEAKKWTIAAEAFSYESVQSDDNISDGISKTLPLIILEKLDANIVRNVYPDENFDRIQFDLKKERMSLFLQLSGLVKTRDSLVLYDYSDSELKRKQKEQDKKINEVKKKIDENLQKLAESEKQFELEAKKIVEGNYENDNKSDFFKFVDMLKHFFSSKDNLYSKEDINFYNNDRAFLYKVPENLKGKPYNSKEFENAMVSANINTLLTGSVTQIGNYYSITVDMYLYPSGKKIASISDVGTTFDFDSICSNIARQLIPIISNSLPVELFVNIQNEDILVSEVDFFIDDILQKNFVDGTVIQSGVHYVQFTCPGYNSLSTSYFFEGNKKYVIDILLEKTEEETLTIRLTKPVPGTFFANGSMGITEENQPNKSKIVINDKLILGTFISDSNENAFFYIPKNMVEENANLSLNLKLYDKGEYVESRRKKMYFSYSLLMVSLIPTFVTYGTGVNKANQFNDGFGNYFEAKKWVSAYNVFMGISIGCGVIFAYQLVRYLIAANQVIPKKPRYTYNFELQKENLLLNNQNVQNENIPIFVEENKDASDIEIVDENKESEDNEIIVENNESLSAEDDILVIDE